MLARVRNLVGAKKYEEARKLLGRINENEVCPHCVLVEYGSILRDEGEYAAALKDYETALKIQNKVSLEEDLYTYSLIASCHFGLNNFHDALKAILIFREAYPDHKSGCVLHIRILLGLNQHSEALKWIEETLKAYPKNPEIVALKATVLFKLGENEAALAVTQHLTATDTKKSDLNYLHVILLQRLRRYDEAVNIAQAFLLIDPQDVRMRTCLVGTYLHAGEPQKAYEEIRTINHEKLNLFFQNFKEDFLEDLPFYPDLVVFLHSQIKRSAQSIRKTCEELFLDCVEPYCDKHDRCEDVVDFIPTGTKVKYNRILYYKGRIAYKEKKFVEAFNYLKSFGLHVKKGVGINQELQKYHHLTVSALRYLVASAFLADQAEAKNTHAEDGYAQLRKFSSYFLGIDHLMLATVIIKHCFEHNVELKLMVDICAHCLKNSQACKKYPEQAVEIKALLGSLLGKLKSMQGTPLIASAPLTSVRTIPVKAATEPSAPVQPNAPRSNRLHRLRAKAETAQASQQEAAKNAEQSIPASNPDQEVLKNNGSAAAGRAVDSQQEEESSAAEKSDDRSLESSTDSETPAKVVPVQTGYCFAPQYRTFEAGFVERNDAIRRRVEAARVRTPQLRWEFEGNVHQDSLSIRYQLEQQFGKLAEYSSAVDEAKPAVKPPVGKAAAKPAAPAVKLYPKITYDFDYYHAALDILNDLQRCFAANRTGKKWLKSSHIISRWIRYNILRLCEILKSVEDKQVSVHYLSLLRLHVINPDVMNDLRNQLCLYGHRMDMNQGYQLCERILNAGLRPRLEAIVNGTVRQTVAHIDYHDIFPREMTEEWRQIKGDKLIGFLVEVVREELNFMKLFLEHVEKEEFQSDADLQNAIKASVIVIGKACTQMHEEGFTICARKPLKKLYDLSIKIRHQKILNRPSTIFGEDVTVDELQFCLDNIERFERQIDRECMVYFKGPSTPDKLASETKKSSLTTSTTPPLPVTPPSPPKDASPATAVPLSPATPSLPATATTPPLLDPTTPPIVEEVSLINQDAAQAKAQLERLIEGAYMNTLAQAYSGIGLAYQNTLNCTLSMKWFYDNLPIRQLYLQYLHLRVYRLLDHSSTKKVSDPFCELIEQCVISKFMLDKLKLASTAYGEIFQDTFYQISQSFLKFNAVDKINRGKVSKTDGHPFEMAHVSNVDFSQIDAVQLCNFISLHIQHNSKVIAQFHPLVNLNFFLKSSEIQDVMRMIAISWSQKLEVLCKALFIKFRSDRLQHVMNLGRKLLEELSFDPDQKSERVSPASLWELFTNIFEYQKELFSMMHFLGNLAQNERLLKIVRARAKFKQVVINLLGQDRRLEGLKLVHVLENKKLFKFALIKAYNLYLQEAGLRMTPLEKETSSDVLGSCITDILSNNKKKRV
jgi:tetratricopeptide (TPR) repeat protein